MKSPQLANAKTLIAVKGLEVSPVTFKNSGGEVAECSINPSLPLGLYLSIDHKTCVITGTPQQLSARAAYTVTAKNESGQHAATIEIAVLEAPVRKQREAIIHENDARADLDTPRSQVENAVSDHAMHASTIKPHEKFAHQPMGDDKRLSQQTANNPDAENRAQNTPELTPSPSAQLQAQAVNAATPKITPTPKPGA